MPKNLCNKTRKGKEDAYEVWTDGRGWTWYVLRKYQADDDQEFARWFCLVLSPFVGPDGEMGDVYVRDVKRDARRVR